MLTNKLSRIWYPKNKKLRMIQIWHHLRKSLQRDKLLRTQTTDSLCRDKALLDNQVSLLKSKTAVLNQFWRNKGALSLCQDHRKISLIGTILLDMKRSREILRIQSFCLLLTEMFMIKLLRLQEWSLKPTDLSASYSRDRQAVVKQLLLKLFLSKFLFL